MPPATEQREREYCSTEKRKGQRKSQAFKDLFETNSYPVIDIVKWDLITQHKLEEDELGRNYSYTADYLNYQQCPRKYMIFKKYGFIVQPILSLQVLRFILLLL